MTAHGFRAMASTLLNESGKWSSDAIERASAHKDKDAVRAAYHRGAHWSERVEMAQWWSDCLDMLRTDAMGMLGSGVTVTAVSAAIGGGAEQLLTTLIKKVGAIADGPEAFGLIASALETHFSYAEGEVETSARMASRRGPGVAEPARQSGLFAIGSRRRFPDCDNPFNRARDMDCRATPL